MHCCVIGLCDESEKSHDYFLNLEKLGDTYRRIYNEKKTTQKDTRREHVARQSVSKIGSLRYGDYGLRTTAGRTLSFVCSTGLSRANIER